MNLPLILTILLVLVTVTTLTQISYGIWGEKYPWPCSKSHNNQEFQRCNRAYIIETYQARPKKQPRADTLGIFAIRKLNVFTLYAVYVVGFSLKFLMDNMMYTVPPFQMVFVG